MFAAYAGSKPPASLRGLLLAMAGRPPNRESTMTVRERIDFAVIVVVFGILVAAYVLAASPTSDTDRRAYSTASFSILTNQIFVSEHRLVGCLDPESPHPLGTCWL